MTITEFLLARIDEDEAAAGESVDNDGVWDGVRVFAECKAKRSIIELHGSWPVMIQMEPRPMTVLEGVALDQVAFQMTQTMIWATNQEYFKRFGTEAPTTPILKALVAVYRNHPDYKPEWS